MSLSEHILDLFFPPKCVFCRNLLQKGEKDYCCSCALELPENDNIRIIENASFCRAPLRYSAIAKDAMIRYKFEGHISYAAPFARMMLHSLEGIDAEVLTFVPVSRRRLWERGYDQTELLAKELSKISGLPLVKTLKKRHTGRQSEAGGPEARRKNIKGAFSARSPELISGKKLLLLDDICTTGATLSEAAQMLVRAGASKVSCIALMMTEE